MIGHTKMNLSTGEIATLGVSGSGLVSSMLGYANDVVGIVALIIMIATYLRAGKYKKRDNERADNADRRAQELHDKNME